MTTRRNFISTSDKEIAACLKTLVATDADTGFMHETFTRMIQRIIPVRGLPGQIPCLGS